MKTILSYTTLSNVYIAPHSYLCKMMGLKTPETDAMRKGKEAHGKLQDIASGKVHDDRFDGFGWDFPTREYHCKQDYNEDFTLHGYLDLCSFKRKEFMEIKTGSKVWNQSQFYNLIQAPYYSLVSGLRKCVFVTCTFDLDDVKVFTQEFTDKDWEKAKAWVDGAIAIITDPKKLTSDLVDGRCVSPRCPYSSNCYFYNGGYGLGRAGDSQ